MSMFQDRTLRVVPRGSGALGWEEAERGVHCEREGV